MNWNFERYRGSKIYLSPFRKDTAVLGLYTNWAQERDLLPFMNEAYPLSNGNQINQWTQNISRVCGNNIFNIVEGASGNIVGICLLLPTTQFSYELRIYIDKNFRTNGYGREAVHILCHIAFYELRAHKVFLHTHALNRSALDCFKACGFVECAVEHEAIFFSNSFYNIIHMELLEDAYVDNSDVLGG